MFNNIYNFSKNSWHVKLFKWIYNIDPTKEFKSMCPYFWTYVITILFFPLVLVIRLFGKSGIIFLNYLKDYRRNREDKAIANLVERTKNAKDLTDLECYNIFKSKCFRNNKHHLHYSIHYMIDDKAYDYILSMEKQQKEKTIIKKQELLEFKKSIIYKVVGYILAISVTLALIFGLYQFVLIFDTLPIDWNTIGVTLLICIGIISGFFIGIGLVKYILAPLYNHLSCIKLPKCYLCQLGIWNKLGNLLLGLFNLIKIIFLAIGSGFYLIGNMIYNTYKRNCPLITWKE